MIDVLAHTAGIMAVRAVEDSFRRSVPEPPDDEPWRAHLAPAPDAPTTGHRRLGAVRGRLAGGLRSLAERLAPAPQASAR